MAKRGRKKKLTPLVAMAKYARAKGLTYGQVQGLVSSGKLTYEQLGCAEKPKIIEERHEPLELKRCPICGTIFEPNRPYQKYCGTRCQERTKNEKYAAARTKRGTENKEKQPAACSAGPAMDDNSERGVSGL